MYVKSIESNCKGGVACALGPKTLLVGRNATGKSGVVNAVELALTGKASDIRGRAEVAKEIDLVTLAPGRKGELYARATLNNDVQAVWQMGQPKAKSKKAHHVVPPGLDIENVLPLRPVRGAILGSVETARKFFLQYAVGKISDADVLARIPDGLHTYYRRGILNAGLSESPVDKLLLALEHAKKQARANNDNAKAARAASAESAQGLAPMPTEATIKLLKDGLKTAKGKLETLQASASAATAMDATRAQLATLKATIATDEVERTARATTLAQAEATLAALPVPATVDESMRKIIDVIHWHVTNAPGRCMICGQETSPVDYTARKTAAEAFVKKGAADAQVYGQATASRDAAKMELAMVETRLTAMAAQAQALTLALDQAAGGGADPVALTQARADVEKLEDEVQKAEVLKASWSVASRARDNAAEAEKESKLWKELADACVQAVTALLDTGVNNFIAKAQSYLPPTDQFSLTLRDGDRQVFDFGLMHNGVLHTALSGAEWARTTAAIAGACLPEQGLSVVIPEERAFDRETLVGVLTAFGKLDAQVIIASPVWPARKNADGNLVTFIPEGWTVINTDADEHRAMAARDITPANIAAPVQAGETATVAAVAISVPAAEVSAAPTAPPVSVAAPPQPAATGVVTW